MITEKHLESIEIPSNLRINDQIRQYRDECRKHGCERPYHHFAFGQSPFSPPAAVVETLRAEAHRHDYLPTAGLPSLRDAVARFYRHHFGLEVDGSQVVVSPGSKEMISIVLASLEGAVLAPTPSWVSYMPQARILRKTIVPMRVRAEDGYKLKPEILEQAAATTGEAQSLLILNHPHNPTGAVYERSELDALAAVCRKSGIVVIADEIYALTSFDVESFTSMGEVYPEGTVVTGGLSKDRGAGGYRLGVGVFPTEAGQLFETVLKIAGSTYSCVSAPIQYAAIRAYSLDSEIERHMHDCRAVNRLVGETTSRRLRDANMNVVAPGGAFYVFLDWRGERERFAAVGLHRSPEVAEDALHVEHAAMLPGSALLLDDDEIAFRLSFVDYDGDVALEAFRKETPGSDVEKDAFFRRYCPMISEGVDALARYLDQIRSGVRPKHC